MDRPVEQFRAALAEARRVVVLTGAGVSAESGIPTFRGAGGLWRRFSATDLATPRAWSRDPGLVWEFYNYRRALMRDKQPNPAHRALVCLEQRCADARRDFVLITQNIDGLHGIAGSRNVLPLHGSLWLIRCLDCGTVVESREVPITPAFAGSGSPDPDFEARSFTRDELPHCSCGGIQRPHVVWFGEPLDMSILSQAQEAATRCDLLLVVGTSAQVYPAASMIPIARRAGATTVEVNLEATSATDSVDLHFQGKAGEVLPALLAGLPPVDSTPNT